jgi:hypothetical protein
MQSNNDLCTRAANFVFITLLLLRPDRFIIRLGKCIKQVSCVAVVSVLRIELSTSQSCYNITHRSIIVLIQPAFLFTQPD